MTIKITEVTWYPIRPTELGLIGFAGLRFGGLKLANIAVYLNPNGTHRLVFPDKKLPNGAQILSFDPVDNKTYELILNAIAEKIKFIPEDVKSYNDKKL